MFIAHVGESYTQDHYFIGFALATRARWGQPSDPIRNARETIARIDGQSDGIEFSAQEIVC